jgi:hypothetical protein
MGEQIKDGSTVAEQSLAERRRTQGLDCTRNRYDKGALTSCPVLERGSAAGPVTGSVVLVWSWRKASGTSLPAGGAAAGMAS